jgi:flagellar assembly factor FliW
MLISTHRFGKLDLACDDLFLFPDGLVGMERMRQWALIPDPANEMLAWLQSTSRPEVSLPTIAPRPYFPEYRVRVSERDLSILKLRSGCETYILTTISDQGGRVTTNLRAPIILNLDLRLGAQLTTTDAQPLRQSLPASLKIRAVA